MLTLALPLMLLGSLSGAPGRDSLPPSSAIASGYLAYGCQSSGVVKVCAGRNDAELFIRGRPVNLLSGYFPDENTFSSVRRGGSVYEVTLGEPGISTDPLYLSYSIRFSVIGRRAHILLISDSTETLCKGTRVRYYSSIDFSRESIIYWVDDQRPFSVRPLRVASSHLDHISFEDHLKILDDAHPPSDAEICTAAGIG